MTRELEAFIQHVEQTLSTAARATHISETLNQLFDYLPENISLADLGTGWNALAAPHDTDDPAIGARRKTCAELAALAPHDNGQLEHAQAAWLLWVDAFQYSDDPRQLAMLKTFERELAESKSI